MPDKDVLLITGGQTPALVTETLYALAERARAQVAGAFRPGEVIIAGTRRTEAAFRTGGLEAKIAELYDSYGLGAPPPCSYAVPDLDDIRTSEDAAPFGNLMAKLVRRLTGDASVRLHLSIAGGRKTMGGYGFAAMMHYGRARDELSHVLIFPEKAEQAADFWYPECKSRPLTARGGGRLLDENGVQMDARDIQVDLALIPFSSVRDILPKELLKRDLDYAEVVIQVQIALGNTRPKLILVPGLRHVQLSIGPAFTLPPADFAYVQMLAEWARDNHIGAGPDGVGANHTGWLSDAMLSRPQDGIVNPAARFKNIYDKLRGPGSQVEANVHLNTAHEDAGTADQRRKDNLERFRVPRSHWKKQLESRISNQALREAYLCVQEDEDGVRYGMNLRPEDITIVQADEVETL